MAKSRGRKQQPSKPQHNSKPGYRKDDIYEAEDVEAPEDLNANRYDRVDNYEYELPSDFEDEEIDEEMAFTEEDKALYGHMFDHMGGRSGGDEGSDLGEGDEDDLSESETEGEEDGLEDEEDELAMFGEEDEGPDERSEGKPASSDEEEAAGAGASEGEGEGEEQDGERHAAMLAAVTGGKEGKKARRHREVVVTEAYPESEYNLGGAGEGGELTLTDLIAGLGDSKAKLGAARKALERLEKKAAPVSAPLPGPIRQRQERKAGYEETKKEVTKWMPLVKAHREAPTLRFTADTGAVPRASTTAALAANHAPETDMEAEVAALLERAGAHSAQAVTESEEALALKALSVEEARERQNKLAKMRALLFYHELKAKRMKKIKSKEYHRKLKKSEKRKAVAAGEAGDEEELQRMMEEAEFERAKERLTLKHKNTSRWARRALKRGTDLADDGTKAAIAEQLRLGQELRRKIDRLKPSGAGSDSDGSTSASDDDEEPAGAEDAAGGFSGRQAGRAMSNKVKAAALDLLEGGGAGGEGNGEAVAPAKGLFALPFMKRALERKKAQAQEEARELLKELEAEGLTPPHADGQENPSAPASGLGGRMTFGGAGGSEAAQRAEREAQRRRQQEAAQLNSDSELDPDDDEDAEAKAQRLGRRLAGEAEPGPATAAAANGSARRQPAGRGAAAAAAAEELTISGAAAAGVGTVFGATEGPLSVELPGRRRAQRLAAAAADGAANGHAASGLQQGQEAGLGEAAGFEGEEPLLPAQHQRLLAAGSGRAAAWRAANLTAAAPGAAAGTVHAVSVGPSATSTAGAAGGSLRENGGAAGLPADAPGFVAARRFAGARPGYAYKKGPKGVGYYLDSKEEAKAARQQRRQPDKEQAEQQQQQGVEAGDSEDEGNMRPAPAKANGAGLSQEELVRMAFAGDDVAAEFAASKAEDVEGELPKVEEAGVLPGWGTWATQQREPKWMVEAREKTKKQRAAAAASRKDAKLQYVIISEKWDKKSSKYKAPTVPFPFDSKETYERAMRQPLGREFNTDASFRNLTRPAVLKDAGVIIEPIRYSKHMAEEHHGGGKAVKASKRPAVATVAGGMPKRSKAARK